MVRGRMCFRAVMSQPGKLLAGHLLIDGSRLGEDVLG